MPTDKFIDRQIARALDREDKLTEWEHDFLMSVAEREKLSERQRAVLNRIVQRLEFP